MFRFVGSGFFGGLAIAPWGGCAVYFAERLAREARGSRIGDVFFIGFLLRLIYWPWNLRIVGAVLVFAGLFANGQYAGSVTPHETIASSSAAARARKA